MADSDSTPGIWEQMIYLVTGWKVPARDSVTGDLQGKGNRNGGGDSDAVDVPWFSVTISNVGKTDAMAAAQRLGALGENFVLFFAGTGDAGPMHNAKSLDLYVAKIEYSWQRGQGVSGSNFHKFANGVHSALIQLQASPWRTAGFSFDGLSVAEEDSVDLGTFSQRAKSFDRAKLFFEEHETRLDGWVNAMGRDNAAWQGNAAGVFVNLLDTLRRQYKHYHEQMAPRGFTSETASVVDGYLSKSFQGNGLIQAEKDLSAAVKTLRDAYEKWHGDQSGTVTGTAPDGSANTPGGHWNCEDVMKTLLAEIRQWLDANNAGKVVTNSSYYGTDRGGTHYSYDLQEGFKENVPAYGSLTDPASWVKVGQEAVTRWTNGVTAHLDPAAKSAQTTLSSAWSKLMNTDWDPAYGFDEAPAATLGSTSGDTGSADGTNLGADIADLLNNQSASVNDALNGIASSTNDALNSANDALSDMGSSTGDALNDLLTGASAANSDLNSVGLQGDGSADGIDATGADSALGVSPAYTSLLNNALNGLGTSNSGSTSVNSDGSITVTNPDGSTTTTRPDGTEVTTYPDGSTLTTDPDGRNTLVNADGAVSVQNADGTLTTTYPDGSRTTLDPDGSYSTSTANGGLNQGGLGPGRALTNPDGSTTTLNTDGSITTTYPDGLTSTLDANGHYTVDAPDPSGVATSSVPDTSSTPSSGLNGSLDGGYGTGASTGTAAGSVGSSTGDGDFLYDDVPYTSSLSGAIGGTPAADGLTTASGLNPGALAAASRMGGLNAEMTTAAERVRSGFSDADPAVSGTARGVGTRSGATAEQALARTSTSSGMPFIPPGAGGAPGGQATQSEDRTRTTWLSEDEEVWGTSEAATPAVLGRDD